MDPRSHATIIVVSRQSQRLERLRSILKVLPQVIAVYGARDHRAAQSLVEYYQPAVALIDGDLYSEDSRDFLQRIHARSPKTRCIVLANPPQSGHILHIDEAGCIRVPESSTVSLLEVVQALL